MAHIDNDHVLWYRLGRLAANQTTMVSPQTMVWGEPVSVDPRLDAARKGDGAWWGACPGPGKAAVLSSAGPHPGRIVLAVYQEGIAGNSDWDPDACRNVNATPAEGDWAAAYLSDDDGATWHVARTKNPLGPWGAHVFAGMSEPSVAELANGSVRMNFRHGQLRKNCTCQMFAISDDGGSSFGQLQFDHALVSPECQAGFMAGAGGALYFSNPHNARERVNMTVQRSTSGGAPRWAGTLLVRKQRHA